MAVLFSQAYQASSGLPSQRYFRWFGLLSTVINSPEKKVNFQTFSTMGLSL